eukprot:TRINITY_DN9144_c0_g1_i1.p1 TRINITY_DN9144_c0_g1~~TRINITY_DN9144_c0_g1_i1.p1  ORF type:complete len:131 (+),score=35.53 TRINITY_DN9144_c0_g1_i1:44-436(+)
MSAPSVPPFCRRVKLTEITAHETRMVDRSVRVIGKVISFDADQKTATIEYQDSQLKLDLQTAVLTRFRVHATVMALGELVKEPEAGVALRVRVVQDVSGIDLGLYDEVMEMQRRFLANEEEVKLHPQTSL